jgi:DNA-binding transcriptional regulator YiaG
MSFMMRIEAAQRPPLDQLAVDYGAIRTARAEPSIDFCRRTLGVLEPDEIVARRLGVPVATVRGWREIGRRADPRSCR